MASSASVKTARSSSDEISTQASIASGKDVIVFKTYRGDISFPRLQIARHSKVFEIKNEQQSTKGRTNFFDLRQFDLSAVFLLIDFINEKDIDDKALSHYAIADLLQLVDIFEMPALNNRLEKLLNVTVDSSADHIVNSLLSVGAHPTIWRSPLGCALFEVALRNYHDLPKASGFHNIPFHILSEILDSCDLMASSENDVFELARKWLKYNHNRVLYAANVLECVRYYRLNDQQRAYIFQSIRKLPQGNQLEMIAKTVIGNHNGFRACVLKAHWQNPRCGSSPKEIRDRPLNIVPNFIDLAHLQKAQLVHTGIKRQLHTDDKENMRVVIRNVHKPRSMREQRRKARELRSREDLESIEKILGPISTTKNAGLFSIASKSPVSEKLEQQIMEKFLGAEKLKSLKKLKENPPEAPKTSTKSEKKKAVDKKGRKSVGSSPTPKTAREGLD